MLVPHFSAKLTGLITLSIPIKISRNFKIRFTTNPFFFLVKWFYSLFSKFQLTNLLFVETWAKLTKLSSNEETADSEKCSHLARESTFPCPGQFPRNCSCTLGRPNFARPIFQNGRRPPAIRCFASIVSLSRAAAFSAAHLFSQPRISRGSMTSAMKSGLSTSSFGLASSTLFRCIKRGIFSCRWARTETGRRETKAVGIKR